MRRASSGERRNTVASKEDVDAIKIIRHRPTNKSDKELLKQRLELYLELVKGGMNFTESCIITIAISRKERGGSMNDSVILEEIKRVPPEKLPSLLDYIRFLSSEEYKIDNNTSIEYGGFTSDEEADLWLSEARKRSWSDEPI